MKVPGQMLSTLTSWCNWSTRVRHSTLTTSPNLLTSFSLPFLPVNSETPKTQFSFKKGKIEKIPRPLTSSLTLVIK